MNTFAKEAEMEQKVRVKGCCPITSTTWHSELRGRPSVRLLNSLLLPTGLRASDLHGNLHGNSNLFTAGGGGTLWGGGEESL